MNVKWPKRDVCVSTHPGHTEAIFNTNKFQLYVNAAADMLTRIAVKTPFDAIAGSGFSGIPICSALSYELGIPLICVRKEDEQAQCQQSAQGTIYSSRYIIIDDLIDSGATIRRIMREISFTHNNMRLGRASCTKYPLPPAIAPECVGILLYCPLYEGDCDSNREYNNIPIHIIKPAV